MKNLMQVASRALRGMCVAAAAVLLTSCGGGGREPALLSGEVRGLIAQRTLVLQVNGTPLEDISSAVYRPSVPFSVPDTLVGLDASYTISVRKHPLGQICAVTRDGSGKLAQTVSTVTVECHATRLNDTGLVDPASTPDSATGRDAERLRLTKDQQIEQGGPLGHAGFDFTKICTRGLDVDAQGGCPSGETWECTRDNVTGLLWRRSDVAYSTGLVPSDWCGRTKWRAPFVHELLSLVNLGQTLPDEPYVDTNFFAVGRAPLYSGEDYLGEAPGTKWALDIGNRGLAGAYSPQNPPNETRRVLWVQGDSAVNDPLASDYDVTQISQDFKVVDTRRDLVWLVPQQPQALTWQEAVESVSAINADAPDGRTDWRLPNRSELNSLVKRSETDPALDSKVEGAFAAGFDFSQVFWTSTPDPLYATLAWQVGFFRGDITTGEKTNQARVIYVRNRVFDQQP
jgi:hypothetical protein